MGNYIKPTKRDFHPDLYIFHVEKKNLSLDETTEMASNQIIDTAKSLMTEKTKTITSNLAPRRDNMNRKEKYLEK